MDEGSDVDDNDDDDDDDDGQEEEQEERKRKKEATETLVGKRRREKKGGSPTTLGRQGRRSRGARGMMNIKAGQAVRVDSTLSARGAPRAKKELSDQYFLCENHGRGGWVGAREGGSFGWVRGRYAEVEQSQSLSTSLPL